MKTYLKTIAAVLCMTACISTVVNAAVTAYEPFNYTAGAFANGTATTATGFTGNWLVQGAAASIVGGLTYTALPTSDGAFQQNPNGRDQVGLASSLSSGTVYISWLFHQVGNNGADYNGLFLPGDGATSLFAGFNGGWSGGAGLIGLGSVTTVSATGTGGSLLAQMPGPAQTVNYAATHLMVLQIDFNTSGVNDTIRLWVDPTANVASPAGNINAPNPDLVVTTYDVGVISGIGFNMQGGGTADRFDELRIGDVFGDVVGVVPEPGTATLLGLGAFGLLSVWRRRR